MLRSRFLRAILIAVLLCQFTVIAASAQTPQPPQPSIAFLNSSDTISLFKADLDKGLSIFIVNSSPNKVDVKVSIIGLDILRSDISSKTLEPGEVFQVNFSSIKPIPEAGTYNGYIVFSDQLGDSIEKKISINIGPTPKIPTIDQTLPTPIDKIAAWIQNLLLGGSLQVSLLDGKTRFGAAEWYILVILVVLALFFLIRGAKILWWNMRGKMGPVFIEEIKDDKENKDKPALTASLRHHLSHCGMQPRTATPGTSIGLDEFNDVLSKSKIPEAAFLQAILVFLKTAFGKGPGYIVTALVSEETPKTIVSIEIKLAQNGKTQYIEKLEADSTEEALQEAAHYIFYRISSRKTALARIPEWLRFPTFASFHQYKCAEELKWSRKYASAIELYASAANQAPFNALLLQGWGDACELNGQYAQALQVYLKAVAIWPHLYPFWYRIAVEFSYVEKWWAEARDKRSSISRLFLDNYPPNKCSGKNMFPAWWLLLWGSIGPILVLALIVLGSLIGKIHGLPGSILGGILGAILGIIIWIVVDIISIGILYKRSGPRRERCLEEALNHNDPITKDDFKEHATDLYKFLVHELGFWEAISNWRVWRGVNAWNAIFEPVQYTAGLTHYLRDYISIPFLGRGNGGQLRRIAAIAQSSVEVTRPEASRSKTNIDGLVRKVDRIVENYWGNRSDVYYDAACFHARLSKFYELGSNKRTQTLEKALEYLKKATKGQHQLEIQWTRLDPDLEVLHENPEFQELFDVPGKKGKQELDDEEIKNKTKAGLLLREGAGQQLKDWGKTLNDPVSLIGLITEAEYQIRMWTSLAALSDQPGDRELQESFWRLVSQKKDPAGLMPKPDESASLPGLDKLNDVWKFTKNCSQAQVEVWKERQADCKSALQQAQAPLNDVWDQWSRLEIGQWQYLQIRTKNLV